MDSFIIRFLICNLFITIIIGILFTVNYLLRNILTAGMKYRLWLLLPGFMTVPFLPHELTDFLLQFSWSSTLLHSASSASSPAAAALDTAEIPCGSGWMNDFTLSVNRGIPSQLPVILWGIRAAGITVMLLLTAASLYQLHIFLCSKYFCRCSSCQHAGQQCKRPKCIGKLYRNPRSHRKPGCRNCTVHSE